MKHRLSCSTARKSPKPSNAAVSSSPHSYHPFLQSAKIVASVDLDSLKNGDCLDNYCLLCASLGNSFFLPLRSVGRIQHTASIFGPFSRAWLVTFNTHRKQYNCVNRRFLLPPRAINREGRRRYSTQLSRLKTWLQRV